MKGVSEVISALLLALIVVGLIGFILNLYFPLYGSLIDQRFTIQDKFGKTRGCYGSGCFYIKDIGTSNITSLKSVTAQFPNGSIIPLDYYIDSAQFIMYTNFDDGAPDGWNAITGLWSISNGRYLSDSTLSNVANSSYPVSYSSSSSAIDFKFKLGGQQSLRKNLEVMIIIDTSGSMADNNKLVDARNAADIFVGQFNPSIDRLGLVNFSNLVTFMQGLTFDQNLEKSKIDSLVTIGGTNIGSGIYRSTQELVTNNRTGAQLIEVLLTDGEVNEPGSYTQGRQYMMAAASEAASDGIKIYTIGFNISAGSNAENDLKQVSSVTGGQYYFAPDASKLNQIYQNISKVITTPIPQGASVGMIEAATNKNPLVKVTLFSGNFTEIRDMTDGSNVTNYFPFNFSYDYGIKVVNQLNKVFLYVNGTQFGEKTITNTQPRGQLILFTTNVTALFDEIRITDGTIFANQGTGYVVITTPLPPGTPVQICTETNCITQNIPIS